MLCAFKKVFFHFHSICLFAFLLKIFWIVQFNSFFYLWFIFSIFVPVISFLSPFFVSHLSFFQLFGMAAMPFLCRGILLFQCNLPRVLPVLILKYTSCLILYIDSFLFLWIKISKSIFLSQMVFLFAATVLKIVFYSYLLLPG